MDKNSVIGLFVIAGILIGWMMFNAPTQEEIARQQQIRDSIEQVQIKEKELQAKQITNKPDSVPV